MGFFAKVWNWIRRKGFKENEKRSWEEIGEKEEELQKTEDYKREDTEKKIKEAEKTIREVEEKEIKKGLSIDREVDVEEIGRRFERSGSISNVQEKLTPGVITETEFVPTRELNQLGAVYNDLLRRNTINVTDKDGNEDSELVN